MSEVSDFDTKIYVVQSLVYFFENVTRHMGPFIEVLIPLVRQLLATTNVRYFFVIFLYILLLFFTILFVG